MVTDFFIRKNKFDLLVKTNTYILIVNKYVTEGEKISDQTRIWTRASWMSGQMSYLTSLV